MSNASDAGVAVEYDPFSGGEVIFSYQSTQARQDIWITSQCSDEASCAYNESVTVHLEGELDTDLLCSSIDALIERHEALRCTFNEDGTVVSVSASIEAPLVILEPGLKQEQGTLKQYLAKDARSAFNLRDGPLFRAALIRTAENVHDLVLTFHSIIVDHSSINVLLKDLGALYTAGNLSRLPTPGTSTGLNQYARRDGELHAGGKGNQADTEYWKHVFAEHPPVLDLPSDCRRPILRTYTAELVEGFCGQETMQALRTIGSTHEADLASVLLAAYTVFLYALTGQTDIVVAVPMMDAPESVTDTSVGLHECLLPIRATFVATTTFGELVRAIRKSTMEASMHTSYSYGNIVRDLYGEHDPSRIPLCSSMFAHKQRLMSDNMNFGSCCATYSINPRSSDYFETSATAFEGPDGLRLSLYCNAALLRRETMHRRVRELETLLEEISRKPDAPVGDLHMLPPEERKLVLGTWNDTARVYPEEALLYRIYAATAASMPEATAICDSAGSLTHREFKKKADALTRSLIACGVQTGDRVGVHMRRSIDMVIALYGIQAAGAAYVPLDPEYPALRLAAIIEDAGIKTICTHGAVAKLEGYSGHCILVDTLDDGPGSPGSQIIVRGQPEDTAYVLYTSGSTGTPKGVEISHRSIANRLYWMQEAFCITEADRVLQKTPFTFDVSVWEFFWPLLFGSTLVVAPPDIQRDARALVDFIKEHGITIVHFVPSMFDVFLEESTVSECTSLRAIICSGEALPVAQCKRCSVVLPQARVFNLYGPTEAAVDVSWYEYSPEEDYSSETVPIGVPVANTRLYILDETMEPKVPGAVGELYIAGIQVGKGYLNKPDLTSRAFISNPFGDKPGERMYRTGDLARWRHDGAIEYMGRNDHQVKIRGNRVEIGEIEAVLQNHEGIQNAAIIARRDGSGENRLHAYIVPRKGSRFAVAEVQAYLGTLLPQAMIPSCFYFLDAMPHTSSGKIDRKALHGIQAETEQPAIPSSIPENDLEQRILALWIEQTGNKSIGIDHNFFEIGGNSLMAIRLMRKIAEVLDRELRVVILFQFPTVRKLASYLKAGESGGDETLAARGQRQRESMSQGKHARQPHT